MENSIWISKSTKPRPIITQPARYFKGRLLSQFGNFSSRHTYLEARFPPLTPSPQNWKS